MSAMHQHLYVVVDDWERGYSVHKFDEHDFGPDPNAAVVGMDAGARPFVRMEALHPHSWSFAALGRKILAMQPPEYSPGIPVLDTETMGMAVWPHPESSLHGDFGSRPLYISAGDRLLAFVYPFVEMVGPELPRPTDGDGSSWSWASIEPPPPFVSSVVSGYAVHPDGRTVFVSVENWRPDIPGRICRHHLDCRRSTFSFDMERHEWTHVGEWLLPFKGQAHYDRELDAWVGLCLYKQGAGRVCCCDVPAVVPPRDGASGGGGGGGETTTITMPAWKLGRDVLFEKDSDQHLGATLVYMGDSRFCMVERRMPPDCDEGYARTRVLKMTGFFLKYDKEGELRVATTRHRAYASFSYEVAHQLIDRTQNPVAFWI
ncbi:hypothetical protein BDA96_06G232200 [Sorghum bicolor]|uniref:Uncharacterized protein n=1 Tax=Sorghum bicolor TaxID=4558 RepID=A0A921UDA1_SORBI|nr:hypothetical protein BDA96_06G232200 [Sorghum bicolor]